MCFSDLIFGLSDKIENLSFARTVIPPLHKLGIKTIGDLLYYPPYRYEDISRVLPIKEVKAGDSYAVKGRVLSIANERTFRRRLILTKALLGDETGEIAAIWFNQPYLQNTLKIHNQFLFSGKAALGKDGLYLQNPLYEKIEGETSPRFLPVYPLTRGMTSRWIRFLIKSAFKKGVVVEDFLPKEILKRVSLLPLEQAVKILHSPFSLKAAGEAKQRIIFERLLLYQLKIKMEKIKLQKFGAFFIPLNTELVKNFVSRLVFKLTAAQKKAVFEIIADLSRGLPMNRLLNGDVGSGKTVVAAAVSLLTAQAGYQVALMAPTEILARQHFDTFRQLLKNFRLPVGLITSSGGKVVGSRASNKNAFLKEISGGEIKILIGTHSLIQKSVRFSNLALIIVDEQHRFGVSQRAELKSKAPKNLLPHFLSLTATPIPRTLALTVYGDLDISILDELPITRKRVITEIISLENRFKVYDFIKDKIKEGRQIFVVCPRIEIKNQELDEDIDFIKAEIKAVESEYENLRAIFPGIKIAKLHGRLKSDKKEKIMSDFKNRAYDILVATSLIEVGIDIPNAAIMIIEGAERFGLAQLHQLRGRVGRGEYQSHCFLFTTSFNHQNNERLKSLIAAKNGFELAEDDLKLRGPGDFLGTRQWGEPADQFLAESLFDLKLIEAAGREANLLLKNDPELKNHPELKSRLSDEKFLIHWE